MTSDRRIPAVLMREHLMQVVDISRSGCLIESRQRMQVGTVGRLRLRFGGEECHDDVEVVRCEAVREGLYQVGLRFLWTTPPLAGTIRDAVARHVEDVHTSRTVWVM
jgi:PilZ domain-containing protein